MIVLDACWFFCFLPFVRVLCVECLGGKEGAGCWCDVHGAQHKIATGIMKVVF